MGYGVFTAPLPFARDRWVLSPAPEEIDFGATPGGR